MRLREGRHGDGARVAKLGEDAPPLLVDGDCHLPVAGDDAVVEVEKEVGPVVSTRGVNGGRSRDLQPRSTGSQGSLVGDVTVARDAVLGQAGLVGRHQHPVPQGCGAHLDRRQQAGELPRFLRARVPLVLNHVDLLRLLSGIAWQSLLG